MIPRSLDRLACPPIAERRPGPRGVPGDRARRGYAVAPDSHARAALARLRSAAWHQARPSGAELAAIQPSASAGSNLGGRALWLLALRGGRDGLGRLWWGRRHVAKYRSACAASRCYRTLGIRCPREGSYVKCKALGVAQLPPREECGARRGAVKECRCGARVRSAQSGHP